jgi:thioesterase domain-containing protein
MAAGYAETIRAFRPSGPYVIAGWSVGGLIALAVARQLQQKGSPANVVLIDAPAPAEQPADEKSNRAWLLIRFIEELGVSLDSLKDSLPEIAALPGMAQLNRALSEARKAGVISADMPLTEFRRLFDSFKAGYETARGDSGSPYQGRVTLLHARQSSWTLYGQTLFGKTAGPARGWENLVSEALEVHEMPGNHDSMLKDPDVGVLAQQLRVCVREALKR